MKIDMSYVEMAFLRRKLNTIQYKLARDIRKQTDIEITKLMKVRFWDRIEKEENIIEPVSELECCNILLWKIAEIEKEMNNDIKEKSHDTK